MFWTTLDLHQPVANSATVLFSAHSFLLTAMFPISGYNHGGILDQLCTGPIPYKFLPGSTEMARCDDQGPEITAVGDHRPVIALFGDQTTGLWNPNTTDGQDQYQALYFSIKDAANKGRSEFAI